MNKEYLKELNSIRKELEIPKDIFIKILLIGYKYQQLGNQQISDDDLFQIIEETLTNYDYQDEQKENQIPMKTLEESLNRAIDNLGYKKINKKNRW